MPSVTYRLTADQRWDRPVKIYEHANAVPVGVLWPDKAGSVSLLGRPLMAYEKLAWGVIDPDAPDRARPMSSYLSYPAENEDADDLMTGTDDVGYPTAW